MDKTTQAINLWRAGNQLAALKIFKGFKIGLTKDDIAAIGIAYEGLLGKSGYYQQLGINTAENTEKVTLLITEKFLSQCQA